MFFNRSEETEVSENQLLSGNPVYILGQNPIGEILAASFIAAGQRAVILDTPARLREFGKKELIVKEDRLLQRRHYKIENAFCMNETPRLLIIAADSSTLKAALMTLSPRKLSNVPVLILSQNISDEVMADFLKVPYLKGYFYGYLADDKNQLSILGRHANLIISASEENELFQTIKEIFAPLDIKLAADEDDNSNFWNYFIPHVCISLLSAAYGKNIYSFTKDEAGRRRIDKCLEELIEMAAMDNTGIEHSAMLKKIYNVPANYVAPLQHNVDRGRSGELNMISSVLLDKAGTDIKKFGTLRNMLREIYNKISA